MTTLNDFLNKLQQQPASVEFEETIAVIDANYAFEPTAFRNGFGLEPVVNEAGQNNGSCKILAFAQLHQLTPEQTLHCFGRFYRQDVLMLPTSTDHANIRRLMCDGLDAVKFEASPLSPV